MLLPLNVYNMPVLQCAVYIFSQAGSKQKNIINKNTLISHKIKTNRESD